MFVVTSLQFVMTFMLSISRRRSFRAVHACFSVWSCTRSLWRRYLTNSWQEFQQIYTMQMGLIRFWGQKVEGQGQGHGEVKGRQRHIGHFDGDGSKRQSHGRPFRRRHIVSKSSTWFWYSWILW